MRVDNQWITTSVVVRQMVGAVHLHYWCKTCNNMVITCKKVFPFYVFLLKKNNSSYWSRSGKQINQGQMASIWQNVHNIYIGVSSRSNAQKQKHVGCSVCVGRCAAARFMCSHTVVSAALTVTWWLCDAFIIRMKVAFGHARTPVGKRSTQTLQELE